MNESEALELMEENFVDESYTRTGKNPGTGNDIRVVNARVDSGRPELRVLPVDSNGNDVPMNKHWLHLADFKERYL